MIDRPAWLFNNDGTPMQPAAEEAAGESAPAFSAEDLSLLSDADNDNAPAVVAQPGQDLDAEIAEIEKGLLQDRRAYLRDAKLQERYLQLLQARDARDEGAEQQQHGQGFVDDVLNGVPEDEREAFEASFDALPAEVHDLVRHQLSVPIMEPARPASAADLKRFAESDIGGELIEEWGPDAPRRLARVQAWINGAIYRDPVGADKGLAWLDEMPPKRAKDLLDRMSK